VLVIDEVPHRPYLAYQVLTADRYVGGDIPAALRQITARVRELGFDAAAVEARRERLERSHAAADSSRLTAEQQALAATGGPVDPVAVAVALRDLIGDDAVVIDETITHSRTIARHLMARTAGRYRYVQGGLGQGIGVALGAKLALRAQPGDRLRDRLAVLTVGDGGWLYNPVPPGLMAAAQYDLPLLVVVFNNGKYLSMRHNHTRAYPEGIAVRTGNFFGVDLSAQPDAAAVASAAGALGITVSSTKELVPALEEAVAAVHGGQTVVVNVILAR
jgi:acetolactate synthase-1/2/3 large subunit